MSDITDVVMHGKLTPEQQGILSGPEESVGKHRISLKSGVGYDRFACNTKLINKDYQLKLLQCLAKSY